MLRASNCDALSGQQKDLKEMLSPTTVYLMQYGSRDQKEGICPPVVNARG